MHDQNFQKLAMGELVLVSEYEGLLVYVLYSIK